MLICFLAACEPRFEYHKRDVKYDVIKTMSLTGSIQYKKTDDSGGPVTLAFIQAIRVQFIPATKLQTHSVHKQYSASHLKHN